MIQRALYTEDGFLFLETRPGTFVNADMTVELDSLDAYFPAFDILDDADAPHSGVPHMTESVARIRRFIETGQ